ncbi:hypothetical protein GSI_08521 [Ganoderma sinense ZZ0214-1]|uniref:Uncharacterized protein n=1 Tax=Ganoderma sinense ZZ0214-1 TaxID=1077348 RepID=A0A2G8S3X0_9APHY|nr:hypothetical protein GSI_08521 [Ganoderma sinense ZZ0214-1]
MKSNGVLCNVKARLRKLPPVRLLKNDGVLPLSNAWLRRLSGDGRLKLRLKRNSNAKLLPLQPDETLCTANFGSIKNRRDCSAEFDKVPTFKGTKPNFYAIPWPVLQSWTTLLPENITEDAVEEFFAHLEDRMTTEEFKAYVSKAHKRFHPNRWDARVILSKDNPELTEMLAAANKTVIQALGPRYDRLFRAEVIHNAERWP